ncbi:hypothetical protein Tco_0488573 [Tanacetum coccineum]
MSLHRRFNSICYDDDDDEESTIPLNKIISPSIAITPVLPTMKPEDSLIMGDENLSTILEKESDEFIKSSVEDLVPIPSESEDTSDSDSDDDESFPEEDVPKENFKIYSNPLFEFDDEYISSDVNPLFNEVLEDIESEDSYVSKLDETDLLVTPLSKLNEDECFDQGGHFILEEIEACLTSDSIPPGIDDDNFDPEGDILLLEKLLNDNPLSPLPPKELNFEELKVIKSNVSTDFKDDYYDSKGDIIYLGSLLINDTILNLPPEIESWIRRIQWKWIRRIRLSSHPSLRSKGTLLFRRQSLRFRIQFRFGAKVVSTSSELDARVCIQGEMFENGFLRTF